MRAIFVAAALMPVVIATASAKPLSSPHERRAERTETMCKLNAQGRHVRGKALDGAVRQCVAQESPNLAYWEHCRQNARHQRLEGLALRDDVDACMSREP